MRTPLAAQCRNGGGGPARCLDARNMRSLSSGQPISISLCSTRILTHTQTLVCARSNQRINTRTQQHTTSAYSYRTKTNMYYRHSHTYTAHTARDAPHVFQFENLLTFFAVNKNQFSVFFGMAGVGIGPPPLLSTMAMATTQAAPQQQKRYTNDENDNAM